MPVTVGSASAGGGDGGATRRSGSMPQRLRRSVLSVPGSNPRMMEKAGDSAADEVFLDLEDACAPLEKPGARAKAVEALTTHDWGDKVKVVRINQVTSRYAYQDLLDIV